MKGILGNLGGGCRELSAAWLAFLGFRGLGFSLQGFRA